MAEPPQGHDEERSRSRALIAILVIAVLVVAAVYLVQALRKESQLEDCLMSGRTNCAPIAVPTPRR